eukprot:9498159-Pyramimonas_sp.AAC.1
MSPGDRTRESGHTGDFGNREHIKVFISWGAMFYLRRFPPSCRQLPSAGGGLVLLPPTFRHPSAAEATPTPSTLEGKA